MTLWASALDVLEALGALRRPPATLVLNRQEDLCSPADCFECFLAGCSIYLQFLLSSLAC